MYGAGAECLAVCTILSPVSPEGGTIPYLTGEENGAERAQVDCPRHSPDWGAGPKLGLDSGPMLFTRIRGSR